MVFSNTFTEVQLYLQILFYICVYIRKQYASGNDELKWPFSDRREYIEKNLSWVRNLVENISRVEVRSC